MTPERWQQIETLYHAAMERAPETRTTFLAEACAEDSDLRREVEALLRGEDAAWGFIEGNALEAEARQLESADLSTAKMPSLIGRQLGAYQVLAPLGKGGMGEVWRARDTRLNREVALKLLPADFAKDADRLKRFEQEARATSALNHPNILTVYDIGTHEGAPFIVAEMLEGEELRAQLNNGALPVRKAIDYAQQIAAGLAAAHDKGIVHRDLKPENLFVTTDGRVKILDFGLAKLRPQKFGGGIDSEAPTLKPLTDPGVVMGTVGYMSPEQVRGHDIDHRSDIFSFGMILYEMLSGKRAFSGASVADVMSAILKEEPPELSETNAKVSPQLDKLVRRCLEKKPERRFQSASDLGFALDALTTPSSGSRLETVTALPMKALDAGVSRRWQWAAIALGAIALILSGWLLFRPQPTASDAPTTWLEITPPHQRFAFQPAPTISPDGRRIAFWAPDEKGKVGLWVRALDSPIARPLPGTAADDDWSGASPFWSPDGRSLGFFADGKLKRIDLAGGTPLPLADASNPRGGSWGADDVIVFVPADISLYRVSASGGEATPLKLSTPTNNFCHWPHFLPDGRHFIMTCATSTAITGGFLAALDSQEVRQLSKVESRMEYADGYVFYGQHGALFAQPFNEHQLALAGEPFLMADSLGFNSGNLISYSFSVSPRRNLVYWSGTFLPLTQLTWFSRTGQRLGTVGEPCENIGFALAPSGQQVVFEQHDPKTNIIDLWLMDSSTGVGSKFTTGLRDEQWSQTPIWSPTDDRLLFTTPSGVMAKSLYGGETEPLISDSSLLGSSLLDISPDGHYALLGKDDPVTGSDFLLLRLTGERTTKPYLPTKHNELTARFSPDGRWIAYVSDESGHFEVYVQSFPEASRKVRISGNGGNRPEWRKDGKELYYIAPNGNLMAVAVNGAGSLFQSSVPRPLFSIKTIGESTRKQYHPSADGTRFLVNARVEDAAPRVLTVVLNWKVEVKK